MALDGEPNARTNSYMVEKSQVCLSPSRKWSWLMHMGVYTEGRYLELESRSKFVFDAHLAHRAQDFGYLVR